VPSLHVRRIFHFDFKRHRLPCYSTSRRVPTKVHCPFHRVFCVLTSPRSRVAFIRHHPCATMTNSINSRPPSSVPAMRSPPFRFCPSQPSWACPSHQLITSGATASAFQPYSPARSQRCTTAACLLLSAPLAVLLSFRFLMQWRMRTSWKH